jgi:hypothetical protein
VAFNGGPFPSSGFPNCPRPQLPVSNSSSSQKRNPNGYLTNSLTHQSISQSQSQCYFTTQSQESELLYEWQFTANQFVLTTNPLRLTTSNFIYQLNPCGNSPYVTSSLTRGWVCHLQLLLVLASAIILKSESRGTHDHILLFQIRDFPNLEGQVPVFIPPRNRVTWLYPQALGSHIVASYYSQGCFGGIRPLLHTGLLTTCSIPILSFTS